MTTADDSAPGDRAWSVRERMTQRTARYVLMGAAPARASRIWIVLHGYGQLAERFVQPFQGLIPDDTCIVAPEALSRFYIDFPRADGSHLQRIGATWLTRESRETEIADAHHWLDLVHDEVVNESTAERGGAPTVGVLAFSQGVATAMRWIASGHVAPKQFVCWAGGMAQDVDRPAFAAKMREAEVVFVAGTQDAYVTSLAKSAALGMIATLAARHRVLEFEGAHHLDAAILRSLLAGFGAE